MVNIKKGIPKKAQSGISSKIMGALPIVILVIIAVLIALNFTGKINLSGFLNPASDNYLNWAGVFNPDNSNLDFRDSKTIPQKKCPETSCDTGACCGSVGATTPSGITPVTYGVITYDYCDCPNDTVYSGTTDRVTPGGPYKICECK